MKKQLLAVVASAFLFAVPLAASADTIGPINFETYSLGPINGQDGWSATGASGSGCATYDEGVTATGGTPAGFGNQSFRISNAVTSGCFGDQAFSKPLMQPAGEVGADNGTYGSVVPLSHFESEFDIAALPDSIGDFLSVSPDRGDGSRMSYLGFDNQNDGIHVTFYDVQGTSNSADFEPSDLGVLSASEPHHIKFVIDFADGPSNDVVNIYIDNVLKHTGTTWENYYRFDPESNPALVPNYTRTVRTMLFRAGGNPVLSTQGNGYLIDNLTLSSSNPNAAVCPVNTTQSALLQTVPVNSSSVAPASSGVLASGQQYLLTSTGTWQNSLNVADTEFASTDNWSSVMDGYNINPYLLGEGEFDLQVDNAFVNWGPYNPSHNYSLLYTGTGSPVQLGVFDGDASVSNPTPNAGWYGDNSGSLSVGIYSCMPNIKYVSGGGNFKAGKGKTATSFWTFGGAVWTNGPGDPQGSFELVDHVNNVSYHFNAFTNFSVTGGTSTFHGTGTAQGKTKTSVEADFTIVDKGEPGKDDTITVSNLTGNLTGLVAMPISGGNFQVFVQ